MSPATLHVVADPLPEAARQRVTLLGEAHDSAADHRWQLDTIRRLSAANPDLVLGFEMFPRADQPVLDAWVAGRLTEAQFFAQADWAHVWGFPTELYAPIFRLARDRRLPMLALNVSHHLVHLAGTSGWASIPHDKREGIANPAPPSAAYRTYLADVMSGHGGPKLAPESLAHFIDAQTVWDSAMAQAIASQLAREPARKVVAILGEGHLQNGWGVPHQLRALGVASTLILLPFHGGCVSPGPGAADALFVD